MPVADGLLELAMRSSAVGMALVAPNGALVEVNPALCRLLDRDEAELCSCTWEDLTHPEDVAADRAVLSDVLDGRRDSFQLVKRYLRPDGSVVHGHLSVACLRDDDGSVRVFVAQVVDLTEQVEASRNFLFLAENVSDVVARGTREGVFDWVSPSVQRELGWLPEEMIGTRLRSFVHPEDVDGVEHAHTGLGQGEDAAFEARLRRKDGDYVWMTVRARPVLDEQGTVVGRVAGFWNSQAEHEVRQALSVSEARFRAGLQAELDAHVFLDAVRDADGCIVDLEYTILNEAALVYVRRPAEEMIGGRMLELFPGQRANGMFDRLARTIDTGVPLMLDGVRVDSEVAGEPRNFDFRAVRVGDGISLTWRDVTERVRAQEVLAESERQARELADRYAAARNEALEANLAKTAFLSRMSHELRTPLNAVLGFAQLLGMDPLSDDQRVSVDHIRAGGALLLDLITEVLDISRIEVGRLALSLESVAADEAVSEALDLVTSLASESAITMTRGPDCGLYVWADRQRAIQILLNLLTNAVKYNRPGGSVTVTCEGLEDGEVAFRVEDTGPGIPDEQIGRLFQPFDRLGAEATPVQGTGIGLTLAQGLARAMSGRIEVESTIGRGSAFSLVLPPSELPPATAVRVGLPTARVPDVRTRILYIEDNPANADLMRHIAKLREGVSLTLAANGASGLASAMSDAPDVIFLDLHLPDQPGEDVIRHLRAEHRTAAVPVVVLTADAGVDTHRRAMALGATAVLTKPVDVGSVLAWIDDPGRGGRSP